MFHIQKFHIQCLAGFYRSKWCHTSAGAKYPSRSEEAKEESAKKCAAVGGGRSALSRDNTNATKAGVKTKSKEGGCFDSKC